METANLKVPIYMYPLLSTEWEEQIALEQEKNPFVGSNFTYEYFGPRAQWLLSAILYSLNLTRYDEIAILTTSDEVYVSICVSIPSFNFARISRVVTEMTKVVIVIHEFGFIYPNIEKQVQLWREKDIIIIEDCAHVIGAEINGKRVGSFGDYTLFSLTKVIPGKAGGLLRTNRRIKLPLMDQSQQHMTQLGINASKKYLSKYNFFNRRRIQAHKVFKNALYKSRIYEPSDLSIPYFTGIMCDRKQELQSNIKWVEWGPTLRNDLVYVPTNPFVKFDIFVKIAQEVLQHENY